MTHKTLNPAQAKAAYDALCALNNVNMRSCEMRFGNAIFSSDFNGIIRIVGTTVIDDERYDDQDAFMRAYGLFD